MANKTNFAPDEWNKLVGGAFMAGFAVTATDPSGLWGLLKETFASGRAQTTRRWFLWFADRGLVERYPLVATQGAFL